VTSGNEVELMTPVIKPDHTTNIIRADTIGGAIFVMARASSRFTTVCHIVADQSMMMVDRLAGP
jgi:hypothetical protein